MRVLVIEDYEPIRTAVAQGLSEAAFAVDTAANGTDGLWYAQSNDYDVILLDLMLPDVDGLKILRQLRSSGSQSRILILTAKDAVEDRIEGLNSGADDYVLKPFVFEELLARVQVLVRRRYDFSDPVIRVSDLVIDTAAQTVERGGRSIELTKREYSLLVFLAMREGQVVSRTEIWENLYEFDSDAHSNVVDVYIRYLRKKLEHPDMPKLIHTRRGFGYVLSLEGADA
ncbi:MAG: response regulator transcription factor [Planctomycetaceae bacterium]|nr:response regulator transcription factor [Planctomycetaceae bacterium]